VRRLQDVGEHVWIRRWLRRLGAGPGILIGPGDDAAVVRTRGRPFALTTDTLVEGVHFRRAWLDARALGRRVFAVNASDLAAMGAAPRFALLAVEAPPRIRVADLDGVTAGFAAAARRAGAQLVGGNVSRAPRLALTAFLVGEATTRSPTRAGARAGDALYVTGTLGATAAAVRALRAGRRGRLPPIPDRVRAGRMLARVANAMIDVSDGLVQDLGHVCRASGVDAEVELAALPVAGACRRALGAAAASFAAVGGEDYELLVSVPPRRLAALRRLVPALGCRLSRIGRVVAGRGTVHLHDLAGREVELARRGFDHFAR